MEIQDATIGNVIRAYKETKPPEKDKSCIICNPFNNHLISNSTNFFSLPLQNSIYICFLFDIQLQ